MTNKLTAIPITQNGKQTTIKWNDYIKTRRTPCQQKIISADGVKTHCLVCERWVTKGEACEQFFGWEVEETL